LDLFCLIIEKCLASLKYSRPSLIALARWGFPECNLRGAIRTKIFTSKAWEGLKHVLTRGRRLLSAITTKKKPRIKYEDIGKWAKKEFKLQAAPDRTTIGRILQNAMRYESIQPQNARLLKARIVKHPHLEQAMSAGFTNGTSKNLFIGRQIGGNDEHPGGKFQGFKRLAREF
jgi:hypothetical protein